MTISIVMALAYKNFVLLTVPTPPGVGLTVTVGSSPVAGWLNMGAADDGNYFTVAIFDCDGDGNPNGLVELIFNATAIANIADNAATSPFTNLYVSLHTSSPGAGGSQTTNEAAYTSYARVAVARTSGGWTVTGSSVVPAATVSFPAATGGSETITHFGIGTASSSTGKLLYFGTVSPNISVSNGVTPQLTTASTVTEQ